MPHSLSAMMILTPSARKAARAGGRTRRPSEARPARWWTRSEAHAPQDLLDLLAAVGLPRMSYSTARGGLVAGHRRRAVVQDDEGDVLAELDGLRVRPPARAGLSWPTASRSSSPTRNAASPACGGGAARSGPWSAAWATCRPWEHMNINPEICRFCLACAEMTGCPGLKHIATDYGLKMGHRHHLVRQRRRLASGSGLFEFRVGDGQAQAPAPLARARVGPGAHSRAPKTPPGGPVAGLPGGVGGMGIGLATSLLVRAGHKEGLRRRLSSTRRAGHPKRRVVSQVVYNIPPPAAHRRHPLRQGGPADRHRHPRGGADPRPRRTRPSRLAHKTAAVINTDKIATIRGLIGEEDFDVEQLEADHPRAHARATSFSPATFRGSAKSTSAPSSTPNIMMLGFAFQKGLIPVFHALDGLAIKDTIRTDFRKNLYAFNMGRNSCPERPVPGPAAPHQWARRFSRKSAAPPSAATAPASAWPTSSANWPPDC